MLQTLKLLIPALLPSWRFFDFIAPSPRVQYALLNTQDETAREWHEFRPRPTHISFAQMLKRMVWNPKWNESLFLVSCAERLMEQPSSHSEDEILKRIIGGIKGSVAEVDAVGCSHIQFRLLLVQRVGSELQEEVVFYSRIESLPVEGIT